MLNNSLSSLN